MMNKRDGNGKRGKILGKTVQTMMLKIDPEPDLKEKGRKQKTSERTQTGCSNLIKKMAEIVITKCIIQEEKGEGFSSL